LVKGESIKVTLPKRIFDIVDSVVKMEIFSSHSDLGKTAIIEYLEKMHLLDQVKNSIESRPLEKKN